MPCRHMPPTLRHANTDSSISRHDLGLAGRSCPRSLPQQRVAFHLASVRQSICTPLGCFFHSTWTYSACPRRRPRLRLFLPPAVHPSLPTLRPPIRRRPRRPAGYQGRQEPLHHPQHLLQPSPSPGCRPPSRSRRLRRPNEPTRPWRPPPPGTQRTMVPWISALAHERPNLAFSCASAPILLPTVLTAILSENAFAPPVTIFARAQLSRINSDLDAAFDAVIYASAAFKPHRPH